MSADTGDMGSRTLDALPPDVQISPAGEWITLKPGEYTWFRTYAVAPTRFKIKRDIAESGQAHFRVDDQVKPAVFIRLSGNHTTEMWGVFRGWLLWIKNESERGDIQAWTGE